MSYRIIDVKTIDRLQYNMNLFERYCKNLYSDLAPRTQDYAKAIINGVIMGDIVSGKIKLRKGIKKQVTVLE